MRVIGNEFALQINAALPVTPTRVNWGFRGGDETHFPVTPGRSNGADRSRTAK